MMMMKPQLFRAYAAAILTVVGCASSDSTSDQASPSGAPNEGSSSGGAPSAQNQNNNNNNSGTTSGGIDASTDASKPPKGPPPSSLPANFFTRPDVGTPLTAAELAAATDKLVALINNTHYFDVVDERLHGWPQTSPGFWYGTWWSGVTITKALGKVTYLHGAGGADNNGLRTAPYLEGACYAHLMWEKPLTGQLVRRMARGYSSWALSMKRSATDTAGTMLSRAHYPMSVTSTEGGRSVFIDYSLNRPGENNGATDYVRLASNPTFGDIWIKNKRSKDDMGQVFRSIAQVQACVPRLDADGQTDLAQMKDLYTSWSKEVEASGWSIASLDTDGNVFTPPATETLAHYTLVDNVECPGALMMRLLGHGDVGSLSCGNGVSSTEKLLGSQMKNGVKQILRTHHEAAVSMALYANQTGAALSLLQGLTDRLESDVGLASQPNPPSNVNPTDIVSLALHAANTGVPLTSKEVRWIHDRLATASASYLAPSAALTYKVFDPSTPDGTYAYDPSGEGMFFSDIGLLIGSCASPYRNPTGRPLLDCARLLAAFP